MRKKTILTIIFSFILMAIPVNINGKTNTTNKLQNKTTKVVKGKHELVGKATYYGEHYSSNRKTASGEVYRKDALTAAHKTLPFGTKVKVYCEKTGKSVIVKINDRGPFGKGRIIDLSVAAAKQLGIIKCGVADIKLQIL